MPAGGRRIAARARHPLERMPWSMSATVRKGAPLALVLALGLAAAPAAGAPDDPLEPVNRAVFAVNRVIDGTVLEPAAELYDYAVPDYGKRRVADFLDNLRAPVVFVNDLLQGERARAGVALGRFLVNSTLGLFGLFDLASELGLPPHDEDFGQTLAVWGADAGPYLVLPVLGPSTARDLVGLLVDGFVFDPVAHLATTRQRIGRAVTEGVVRRAQLDPFLDDLRAHSLDYYAALRSAYLQRRTAAIRNGRPMVDESLYELEDPASAGPGEEP